MKISETSEWDQTAQCPACKGAASEYHRVIRASLLRGGVKAAARSESSRKETQKALFTSSGERDAMRHRESKTRDKTQVAEAVEKVRKGHYEGF
jgi:hypothetical protein